ncbi:MFS transporter [Streptomyces sp. NBC_00102]|uniref:MFS transporter n=1 Tax=Streptomyces sp. NBC_00102 TaxID=2975652 RepID=UPI00225BBBDE|nr:MFS transporter [Streptomyces sp. NBC_00102]MCX5400281.1 MFS transporter [Streptomyces sp. NBC_00102]
MDIGKNPGTTAAVLYADGPAEPGNGPPWPVARGLIPERGPRRTLAVAFFVNMIGAGLYMTGAALFFTRSVGLSVAQVGLGMGAASMIGLFAGIPVGRLADMRGARETYLVTLAAQAAGMTGLLFVHSFWLFTVTLCAIQLANSASAAARGPLVRGFAGRHSTAYRSYLRAAGNLAGSFGALAAGVVVQLDTRAAYASLVLGNALTFLACAAVISRLPRLAPVQAPAVAGRWSALKDRPFMAVILLDGIMAIQGQVLVFALPLWIVGHSDAPRWLVGVSAVLNTLMVVALQVRAARDVDSSTTAARAVRRSGPAFLVGMTAIAVTGGLPAIPAAVLILVGVAMHTIGELWHEAGSLELSFALAPEHAQGQYSGLSGMGHSLANSLAPSLLGLFCVTWGAPGWIAAGGVFVAVGLVMPYAVRWAERTREGDTR